MESIIEPLKVTCPQCKREFILEYHMYVDVESDPQAKQDVIADNFRRAQCPHCGTGVIVELPLVYHDRSKELLIYYIPEALLPQREEINRFLGKINREVMESLPPSQRKGYLLRPKEIFSWAGFRKEVLLADGMSEEEVEEWERTTRALEELLRYEGDESGIEELLEKHRDWITLEFVKSLESILLSSINAWMEMEDNEELVEQKFSLLQAAYQWIVQNTEIGEVVEEKNRAFKAILSSNDPAEMAEALDGVPTEFVDVLANAMFSKFSEEETEEFIRALARRIVKEKDPAKAALLRKKKSVLVKTFNEIIKETSEEMETGMALLTEIMEAQDIREAIEEHIDEIDDRFISAWTQAVGQAAKSSNKEAYRKLIQIRKVYHELLEEFMPPQVLLVYKLGNARYPDEVQQILEENKDKITPEFFDTLKEMMERARTEEEKKLWSNVYAMAALMG